MPRYVVLWHEVPKSFPGPSHWDLMLEVEDGLLTWSLPRTPESGQIVSAESRAHHRKMYLDYEGAISQDRGRVRRWDCGDFDWLQRNDDRVIVCLRGHRLQGKLTLQRTAPSQTWQLTFASGEDSVFDGKGASDTDRTDRADQRG